MFGKIETADIELHLRDLVQEAFKYSKGQINGTDLGMSQVTCAVEIKDLFVARGYIRFDELETVYGSTLGELRQIIDFAQSKGFKPKKKK